MSEAELGARFAEMVDDAEYQAEAIVLALEFERIDWEAFHCTESLADEGCGLALL
jgi:hypothetical protein